MWVFFSIKSMDIMGEHVVMWFSLSNLENTFYALFMRIFNNIYHFWILNMAQIEILLG